jgi:hypothetical protein
VGKLTYASLLRPDLKFRINLIQSGVRYLGSIEEANATLKYLVETRDYELVFNYKEWDGKITLYSDASYNDRQDSRSSIGYLIRINNGLIIYSKSTKVRRICTSVAEAEYMSLSQAYSEAIAIYYKMKFLKDGEIPEFEANYSNEDLIDEEGGLKPRKDRSEVTFIAKVDSQAARFHAIKANGTAGRLNHIHPHVNRLREDVNSGILRVDYIPRRMNLADALTKTKGNQQMLLGESFCCSGSLLDASQDLGKWHGKTRTDADGRRP